MFWKKAIGAAVVLASINGASAQIGNDPVYPEQKTPRDTLKFFSSSIRAAETRKVRACLYASSALEAKMADATAGAATAVAKLRLVAIQRFGPHAGEVFSGGVPTEQDIQRIESGEEKIEGDKATVTVPGAQSSAAGPAGPASMKLVRVAGGWKINLTEGIAGQSAAKVEKDLATLNATIRILADMTDEIAGGKYKTHMEAFNAMKKKMRALAAKS